MSQLPTIQTPIRSQAGSAFILGNLIGRHGDGKKEKDKKAEKRETSFGASSATSRHRTTVTRPSASSGIPSLPSLPLIIKKKKNILKGGKKRAVTPSSTTPTPDETLRWAPGLCCLPQHAICGQI